MPSWELFDDQDKEYRDSVLPPQVRARVSVEMASDFGWSKYTGSEGRSICIETFGASAPLKQLAKKFGFNADHVVAAAKDQIALHKTRNEGWRSGDEHSARGTLGHGWNPDRFRRVPLDLVARNLAEGGVPITQEQFLATFGQRNDSILPQLLGTTATPERIERISTAKEKLYRDLVRGTA